MWLDYIRERMPEKSILEQESGFAIYYPCPVEDAMYIEEVYVKSHWRRSNVATEMMLSIESMARDMGFKYILGSCDPTTEGANTSLKGLLARDFELYSVKDGLIFLRREIK